MNQFFITRQICARDAVQSCIATGKFGPVGKLPAACIPNTVSPIFAYSIRNSAFCADRDIAMRVERLREAAAMVKIGLLNISPKIKAAACIVPSKKRVSSQTREANRNIHKGCILTVTLPRQW
jgi:hypothetical protein